LQRRARRPGVSTSGRAHPTGVAAPLREAHIPAALTDVDAVGIRDLVETEDLSITVMELVNGMPLLPYPGDDCLPLARKTPPTPMAASTVRHAR
jgi:hypothetical protein